MIDEFFTDSKKKSADLSNHITKYCNKVPHNASRILFILFFFLVPHAEQVPQFNFEDWSVQWLLYLP